MAGRLAGKSAVEHPFERPPDRVLADVRDEKVSVGAARDVYGVAIDPVTLSVDAKETERLRTDLRAAVDVESPPLYLQ